MDEVFNNRPNDLLATNVYKTLESCEESLSAISTNIYIMLTVEWTNTTSVSSKCGTFAPFSPS